MNFSLYASEELQHFASKSKTKFLLVHKIWASEKIDPQKSTLKYDITVQMSSRALYNSVEHFVQPKWW